MLESIVNLDLSIFYFINKSISNPVFDFIMPIITEPITWLPIIAVFMIYQFLKCGIKGKLCIASLLIGVLVCDQLSSSLIKSLVNRPRPCHVLSDINLLVTCGAGKSFPSSHAANSMMLTTVISLFYRKHKYWLSATAIIIGFSRIYVGVHHPFDVLCGLILGVLVGCFIYWLVMYIYDKYVKKIIDKKKKDEE